MNEQSKKHKHIKSKSISTCFNQIVMPPDKDKSEVKKDSKRQPNYCTKLETTSNLPSKFSKQAKVVSKVSCKLPPYSSLASIEYQEKLTNFNMNYEQLIYNLKHKKDYLNVLDDNSESHAAEQIRRNTLKKNLEGSTHLVGSNKVLPEMNKTKLLKNNMLDDSFEFSFMEKDNFQDLSKYFTTSILKKYSMLPNKDFCVPQIKVKLEDEIYFDLISGRKKMLIIDLVDTLVRVKNESYNDSVIEEVMNELETNYSLHIGESELHIQVRPGLFDFLNKIKKYYHIIVFTSSSKNYAEPILNYIDKKCIYFSMRLYQNYCSRINSGNETIFLKDLRIFENIDKFRSKVICVDDDLMSFAFNLDNAVPIMSFSSNPNCYVSDDDELWFLGRFLIELNELDDVRKEIASRKKSEFEEKMKKLTKFVEFI